MRTNITQLLEIMRMLRDREFGCPWDIKQDFASIAPHTLEEAYEVIDAIERKDFGQLRNELGDLLFQVIFYSQLAEEQNLFVFEDVVNEIVSKLLSRHPHVFSDGTIESFGKPAAINPEQVENRWEELKANERTAKHAVDSKSQRTQAQSLMDDLPLVLPALSRARKLQKRAAHIAFDWSDVRDVIDKLKEELLELETAIDEAGSLALEDDSIMEEMGDVLFSCVNLARHLKLDAETVLRNANRKFERRFRLMETLAAMECKNLRELEPAEMEVYWQRVKLQEGDDL
jgi:nucleoside triphosphate diphosphatase